MEGALTTLGLAAAALLVVAIAVAWWEQTGSDTRIAAPPPRPQALTVDVHLDALNEPADPTGPPAADAAAAVPAGDQATRDAVMGRTLMRMAQPAPSSIAWMETQPMVAPGQRTDPVPTSWG